MHVCACDYICQQKIKLFKYYSHPLIGENACPFSRSQILFYYELIQSNKQTAHFYVINITGYPTSGNPQPPQLNVVCGVPSGNYPIIWNYAALLSFSITKFILIGAMFPHLQQPATLPQHRVSSGRSLFLRSLCPAASGSANIIHIIESCCKLILFLLFRCFNGGYGLPGS